MSAQDLLAPAVGDRINKAFLEHLDNGIDLACQYRTMQVPMINIQAGGVVVSTPFFKFKPPVDITPVMLILSWITGVATTQYKLYLRDSTATAIASVTPTAGASSTGRSTTFTGIGSPPVLTAGSSYDFTYDTVGTGAPTSMYAVLVYRIPYTKQGPWTDDTTLVTTAQLNNMETGCRDAGRAHSLTFGIINSTTVGRKAMFKLPALPSGMSWEVVKFAGSVANFQSISGTPSITMVLKDTTSNTQLSTVTPAFAGNGVFAYVEDNTVSTIPAGNLIEVNLTAVGGTGTTVDSASAHLWFRAVYTPRTWSTKNIFSANAGTAPLEKLDKAVQAMCDNHFWNMTPINFNSGLSETAPSYTTADRRQYQSIQFGYKVQTTSADTFKANFSSTEQVSDTVAANTTKESVDDSAVGSVVTTSANIEAAILQNCAATTTVTYMGCIVIFSIGEAAVTKVTTSAASSELPALDVMHANKAQVSVWSVNDTMSTTPSTARASGRTALEVMHGTETTVRNVTRVQPKDTLAQADSNKRDVSRTFSNTVTRAVTVLRGAGRTVTDTSVRSEARARAIVRVPVVTMNTADSRQRNVTRVQPSDTVQRSPTFFRTFTVFLNETLHRTEATAPRNVTRSTTEVMHNADADKRNIVVFITETMNRGVTAVRNFARLFSNSIAHTPTVKRDMTRSNIEVVHHLDSRARALSRAALESVTGTVTVQRNMTRKFSNTVIFGDVLFRDISRKMAAEVTQGSASLHGLRRSVDANRANAAKSDLDLYMQQILQESYWASILELYESSFNETRDA